MLPVTLANHTRRFQPISDFFDAFLSLEKKKRNDVLNPSKLDNTPPITPEMRPKSHAHVVVVVYYLPPLRSGLKQLWVGCLAWKRLPSADQTWFAGELHMCPLICFF